HTGDSDTVISADDTATFNAGNNLTVDQSGQTITYALNKDLTGLNSVQVGGDSGPTISGDGNGNVKVGGDSGKPVKITNVADGTDDNDAVNVSQLEAAQTHYYSVNDDGTQAGNYDNDGATGTDSLARSEEHTS